MMIADVLCWNPWFWFIRFVYRRLLGRAKLVIPRPIEVRHENCILKYNYMFGRTFVHWEEFLN